MKRLTLGFVLSSAVLVGMFFASVETRVTGAPVVADADALSISTYRNGPECGGGKKPICRQCSGRDCIRSCTGDYTCYIGRNEYKEVISCGTRPRCESDDPTPNIFGTFSYIW